MLLEVQSGSTQKCECYFAFCLFLPWSTVTGPEKLKTPWNKLKQQNWKFRNPKCFPSHAETMEVLYPIFAKSFIKCGYLKYNCLSTIGSDQTEHSGWNVRTYSVVTTPWRATFSNRSRHNEGPRACHWTLLFCEKMHDVLSWPCHKKLCGQCSEEKSALLITSTLDALNGSPQIQLWLMRASNLWRTSIKTHNASIHRVGINPEALQIWQSEACASAADVNFVEDDVQQTTVCSKYEQAASFCCDLVGQIAFVWFTNSLLSGRPCAWFLQCQNSFRRTEEIVHLPQFDRTGWQIKPLWEKQNSKNSPGWIWPPPRQPVFAFWSNSHRLHSFF